MHTSDPGTPLLDSTPGGRQVGHAPFGIIVQSKLLASERRQFLSPWHTEEIEFQPNFNENGFSLNHIERSTFCASVEFLPV